MKNVEIQNNYTIFDEINSGNDILHHFVWIDYFTLLRLLKEA